MSITTKKRLKNSNIVIITCSSTKLKEIWDKILKLSIICILIESETF